MININKNKFIFLGSVLVVSIALLLLFVVIDTAYAVHNDDHVGCDVNSPTKSSSATLGEPDSPYVITGSCVVPGDHGQNHATYGIWNRTDGYWIIGPTTV